jgi:hypothetical protein
MESNQPRQPESHEFVNCPTCHGRGVVPLETAEVLMDAGLDRQRADWAHRVAMVEADNKLRARRDAEVNRQRVERLTQQAEQRQRELEGLVFGRAHVEKPGE